MATKIPPTRSGDSIKKASTLSVQGNDKKALEVIQKHLLRVPRDVEALKLAGTLAARLENWEKAERYFTAVLALDKGDTYSLYSLSKVYKLSNRAAEAINALSRLLSIEPRNVQALNEIGVLLNGQGALEPAIRALEIAVALDPTFEMAYRNLYATLYAGAHYEEAVKVAKQAIENIKTDYRWHFRSDLIVCLWKAGAIDEAKVIAEAVVDELDQSPNPEHRKHLFHTLNNYGVILMEVEDTIAAEKQFRRVIEIAPHNVDPYVNMAKLAVFREDMREAIHWFDKALAIDQEHAELQSHLAIFLRDSGRPDLALPHHLLAISKSPGNLEMRYYLGITQLALGRLQDAYPNWELRWSRREGGSKSDLPIPEWTGEPACGRSLLVYREQGIGDEIVFASCLPDLTTRFKRVLCVCHSKLKVLFTRSFPEIEFVSGENALTGTDVAAMEWQIASGSLPVIVRPDLESFPHRSQLLIPDPLVVERFRSALTRKRTGLTIGIAWRSGLLSLNRRALYPYLDFWKALFDIPGVNWVNLQYGDVSEELCNAEKLFDVSIVNFDEVDHFNDIDTSAALMKACDLIIGPDTSTTQIAAAVGTPTIRIYSGCDYFRLGTDHYPWFPSLTTIPRHFGESWLGPIERTAAIIETLVAERST